MERWNAKFTKKVENKKIDAFLEEIASVSKKHGFIVGHEDIHGSPLIWEYDEECMEVILDAHDDTD